MKALPLITLIRRWMRNLVPVATTFAFVLVGQLPLPLPFLSDVAPAEFPVYRRARLIQPSPCCG